METHRAAALRLPYVDVAWPFGADICLFAVGSGVHNGSGAPLAGLTVADIHTIRLSR
jgi:hypothetical protein